MTNEQFGLLFFQVPLVIYFLIPEHKMNKIISTNERILMYLVGPSGSGKTVFINDMLRMKTFQPSFDRILYFYKHFQPIYDTMMQSIADIEFIQGVDFDLIDNLPADGTKYLLIFDDSVTSDTSSFINFQSYFCQNLGQTNSLDCYFFKCCWLHISKYQNITWTKNIYQRTYSYVSCCSFRIWKNSFR